MQCTPVGCMENDERKVQGTVMSKKPYKSVIKIVSLTLHKVWPLTNYRSYLTFICAVLITHVFDAIKISAESIGSSSFQVGLL